MVGPIRSTRSNSSTSLPTQQTTTQSPEAAPAAKPAADRMEAPRPKAPGAAPSLFAARVDTSRIPRTGDHPTLKKGTAGPDVERLQKLLNQVGNSVGTPDGAFGPKTDHAVKAFQQAHGLSADGVVGPKTWTALEAAAGAITQPSTPVDPGTPGTGTVTTSKERVGTMAGTPAWRPEGKTGVAFKGELTIDADGSPHAYHPEKGKGLDNLANAGHPGNWWGIATNSSGKPYVQGPNDPAPGYYVSTTALEDTTKAASDPKRYVDSETIPYMVIPKDQAPPGTKLGDICAVVDTRSGNVAYAIYGDIGPKDHVGEGSMALARDLGLSDNPHNGGAGNHISYVIFPGSGDGKMKTAEEIKTLGKAQFDAWGGKAQLEALDAH